MYGTHTDVLNKLKGNKNIRIINVNNKVVQCVGKFISKCMNQYRAEKLKNKLVRYLVIRHIKNNNYDVVIRYHHAAIKTLFTRLKKKRNQKFVTWYHRSIPTDYYLNKEYLNNCDKVIVVAEGCKQNILKECKFLKDKIFVIDNLVPYKEILSKMGCSQKLFSKDNFNIVTCARIDMEKGIDTAIETCKILKSKIDGLKWYVIGNVSDDRIEYGKYIEDMIKKYGLEEEFILLGGKQNPYPYFAQCDLYVQPSKEEACPLTTTEAQICCAPIVATETVGAKHLIKNDETGIISKNNPRALADAIYDMYINIEKRIRISDNVKKIDFEAYNNNILDKFYSIVD